MRTDGGSKFDWLAGRAEVAAETGRPVERHAAENLPVGGDWLAGKLFGTAENVVPVCRAGERGKRVAAGCEWCLGRSIYVASDQIMERWSAARGAISSKVF